MASLLSILCIFFLIPSLLAQTCEVNNNLCAKCNEYTNLCEQCLTDLAKPDEEGGCGPVKKCTVGKNYCKKCDNQGELCQECEQGFLADLNGGCSYAVNCEISENGRCIKCLEDFYLIGDEKFSFCKYKALDDFKNCEIIDSNVGKCEKCLEGFNLSASDGKCVETENCDAATFGICDRCVAGFYLDKTDDKCKKVTEKLYNCLISLDGETCNECIKGNYLSEDGLCSLSSNCKKTKTGSDCLLCKGGYNLSRDNTCTKEKNCAVANKETGKCEICENGYYLDVEMAKCFSNQKDDQTKNCAMAKSDICLACIANYYLGEDSQCTLSQHCLESENGKCTKCEENFHLGEDNKCTNTENCVKSDFQGCTLCKEKYYYDTITEKCEPEKATFVGCARAYGWYCQECREGFYLNNDDKLCYSNTKEEEAFYKCKKTDFHALMCLECEEGYYLGTKDYKCSKIQGCAVLKNEEECDKCDEHYCKNVNTGKCVNNYNSPNSLREAFYYACNVTDEEGTSCKECVDDKYTIEGGICVNKKDCEDEGCTKCAETDDKGVPLCLNEVLGCVRTSQLHCLKCNDVENLDACTECEEGYTLNNMNECV